jgi:hypothetical protein
LINGETTSGKITEGTVVEKLLAKLGNPNAVAEALYIRCYSRAPSSAEAEKIASKLAGSPDQTKALQDLFWALLNSNEFLFNH